MCVYVRTAVAFKENVNIDDLKDESALSFKLVVLTVHRRSWYLISSRTMLAVPVAMENSCCSVTLERKPLNMKMLGAITTETLLRVILFWA